MKIYPTLEITVGTLFESVFIRDYTGKVDELIKDKIEAQKEVKAKQHEEKEVTELQVRTCMLSYYLLRECRAWVGKEEIVVQSMAFHESSKVDRRLCPFLVDEVRDHG
ncbi:hypothetical protein V6N12_069938 [Hibiscus sabdariffa]|uniref:Uncharacterized protein n=1 Tax=Hibiscus sabdariffa TaxID=183260 RepID=A0ABR2FFW3_9ROSI